ncbi:cytoskeleton protein RodZ [bacterium BMS3Bbin11]|nr:cytoskeleton protein RodZ [bacterium BMS3Abin11]GBE46115.1 cytoskeleton protein RodZ [bacterium BMS3Bbin11]GMT39416.1 MAG: hypothetical protein IEMM0001_0151 [bacterium]HDH08599.1 helix-turn-helix domain-containing protein [Gammaproteobacteria bacterium]HDH16631.1 helix-turn-helix domain-containing protein [Gammaproteobacteria bacterium]
MNEEIFPNGKNRVPGPGRLLQIAREEKNLRPEDIAYEIRLTPSQVLALDEDDYSKMPEETYVRGYLRNYARLVGVPENDILMAFARLIRTKDTIPTPVSMPAESETNKKSRVVWLVAVASIVAVIVLSAVWVLVPYDELPLADSSSGPPVVDEKPGLEEVPVGTSTLNLDKSAVDPGLNVLPVSPANEQEVASEIKAKSEISASVKSANIAQTIEATNTSNDQNNTGSGVLLINYSKDSWTDVRDANGRKLLYRTVKAGEKIALAGELPISLFFGFAQGVNVKFNGKPIDIPAHTRGVFARFTVGEAVNQ